MSVHPHPWTLAIDIGGSGIKAMLLDHAGKAASERIRRRTPHPATPRAVLAVVGELAREIGAFDRISVGFPGVVQDGVVLTATNLHRAWIGVRPEERLRRLLGKPVRVANDADVQGLGIVKGRGVELVLTLGTGVGSALFLEGRLVPNLELGHHPFKNGRTYEDMLGESELLRIGGRRWNRRVRHATQQLLAAFNPRRLYVGGGNARLITKPLAPSVEIASNIAGLLGGIRLWDEPDPPARRRARTARAGNSSARDKRGQRRPRATT